MKTYEIETAEEHSDKLKRLLADGWEPFGVAVMQEQRHNSRGYLEQEWEQVVYHMKKEKEDEQSE